MEDVDDVGKRKAPRRGVHQLSKKDSARASTEYNREQPRLEALDYTAALASW